MKKFIVTIPNEINNAFLEEFLQCKLNMEFFEDNLGEVKYISDTTPRDFKKKILKNFGTVTLENLEFGREDYFYEDEI
jgi:hypothetical protein